MDTPGKWTWRLDPSGRRVRDYSCKPGEYPWDDWYGAAREAGVSTELALLGSIVMREADQQGWDEELQAECGWSDAGAAMLSLAVDHPARARSEWQRLLDEHGQQGPTTHDGA